MLVHLEKEEQKAMQVTLVSLGPSVYLVTLDLWLKQEQKEVKEHLESR